MEPRPRGCRPEPHVCSTLRWRRSPCPRCLVFDPVDGSPGSRPLAESRSGGVGSHLVTTVFDLMLAKYGVGPRWVAGLAHRIQRRPGLYTPAWQESVTGVPGADRGSHWTRVRRQRRGVQGRSMIVMGAGTNHWFHSDTITGLSHADDVDRMPRSQRWRVGTLRRAGEGPADHWLHPDGECAGLEPPAPAHDPDCLLVPAHGPVPLRPLRCGHLEVEHRQGESSPARRRRTVAQSGADGWMPSYPNIRPQLARAGR